MEKSILVMVGGEKHITPHYVIKAKEVLSILPKENIEGVYEITEEAEHFLREVTE